ncbi:MAG: hypothetical protein ABIJ61_11005 [bacterium]
MKRYATLALILLLTGFASEVHAGACDSSKSQLSLRLGTSTYWLIDGNYTYFKVFSSDQLGQINRDLSPRTVIDVTWPNIEILWRMPSLFETVSLMLDAKYQSVEFSISDTMDVIWEWGKHTDADLDLFSAGVRMQFSRLPLKPYIGLGLGYCTGSLTTVHNRDGHQLSIVGNGSGYFGTTVIGGSLRVWRGMGLFVEASTISTSEDGLIEFVGDEKISGSADELGHLSEFERYLYIQGYQVGLGVEIPVW